MSPDTQQLQGLVEEASYRYLAVRTEENREALTLAWVDFLEALRSDWTTTCKTCVGHGHYDYKSCKACGGVGKRVAA